MPKSARLSLPHSWFHVMNRGNSRKHIFLNEEQRNYFLHLLEVVSSNHNVEIHAFCLMGNHYHLLVKTNEDEKALGKAMHFLQFMYARRFNDSRNRDGSLFRGRFKSIWLSHYQYVINVARYIHLNPFEASMVKDAVFYEWSSLREYLFEEGWGDIRKLRGKDCREYPWLKTQTLSQMMGDVHKYTMRGIPKKIKEFYSKERIPSKM